MKIKDFSPELQVFLNKKQIAFADRIYYQNHLFNPGFITLHNVVFSEKLANNQHFLPEKIMPFAVLEIKDRNNNYLFKGFVESFGRFSLLPNSLKDFSLKAYDFKFFLDKLKPPTLEWVKTPAIEALKEYISFLEEENIVLGQVDFDSNNTISFYNSQNKTVYSVLKNFFASFSNCFLFCDIDSKGRLVINFLSEKHLKQQPKIEINNSNIADFQIEKIDLDQNGYQYANTLALSSNNIFSEYEQKETVFLNPINTKINLTFPVFKFVDNKNFYFFDNKTKQKLIIINSSQKNYLDYHIAFSKNEGEIEVNPNWKRDAVVFLELVYLKKSYFEIELQNKYHIEFLKSKSNFNGIVYYQDKTNDLVKVSDLFVRTQNWLKQSQTYPLDLEITASKAFLKIGDSVFLNLGTDFDGVYFVVSFSGSYNASIGQHSVSYFLKNSINGDSPENFYESQSWRSAPDQIDGYPVFTNAHHNIFLENLATEEFSDLERLDFVF